MDTQQEEPVIHTGDTNESGNLNDFKPLPVYYPLAAIMVFTIVFGSTFGAIMFAINCHNKPRDRSGVFEVILFGILFNMGASFLGGIIGIPIITDILFSIIAAIILKYAFWDKYIGKDTVYKNKSLLWPVLIGAAILVLYFSWGIYKGLHPEVQPGM